MSTLYMFVCSECLRMLSFNYNWSVSVLTLISLCLQSASSNLTDRYCWPGNAIPYLIAHDFTQYQVKQILLKISVFHTSTCLRWVDMSETSPQHTVNNMLSFVKAPAGRCSLSVRGLAAEDSGGVDAKVWVSVELSDFCFEERLVLHLMMQALGFRNEHQRYDRNCYVEVSSYVSNPSSFQIQPQEPWLERYPYDILSVMHYRQSSVLNSRRNLLYQLGSADGSMSELDLSKILFKFCSGPHICDLNPDRCQRAESYKRGINCHPQRSALNVTSPLTSLFKS